MRRKSRSGVLAWYLLIPLIALMACDEDVTGPELPKADPETVLVVSHLDDENDGTGVNNWTAFEHFDVVAGCVDLHGNGYWDVQPGKGLYIDMDGSCWKAGTIETREAYQLVPEEAYVLEIWLAGNNRHRPADTMDVTIGDIYSEQFVLDADEDFKMYTRELTVLEPTEVKMRFAHYGGDNHGILVDLIRIRRIER